MLFSDLMQAIHPHLKGTDDIPTFVRDILERLSAVPEPLWGTARGKEPASNLSDDSLRKFYHRGISKKLARQMLKNPTRSNFVDSLEYVNDIETESADEIKAALAESIAPFTDEEVDETNVGEILFDLFQLSFKLIVDPDLEENQNVLVATRISDNAKKTFGSRLLEECKHTCSFTGCGKHLLKYGENGHASSLYAILRISGSARSYDNFIACCMDCFQTYTLGHKAADERSLRDNKVRQQSSMENRLLLSSVEIEHGICKVIEALAKADLNSCESLNYEPAAVKDKINPESNYALYDDVLRYVVRYYLFIERRLQKEVQLRSLNDNLLRSQIKAQCQKLSEKNKSKTEIFDALTDYLQRLSKQEKCFCCYVVSYFVQSCEVFDVAS